MFNLFPPWYFDLAFALKGRGGGGGRGVGEGNFTPSNCLFLMVGECATLEYWHRCLVPYLV